MKRRRIFISIPVPPDIIKRLFKAVEPWRDLPVRWTKPENAHVTVLFIGGVDDEELARVAGILPLAVRDAQPFDIETARIGLGPSAAHPRMVWAEGSVSEDLGALQRRVEELVFERGRPAEDPEGEYEDGGRIGSTGQKRFRLHITLGRVIPFKWKQLNAPPDGVRGAEIPFSARFSASAIHLMESELTPQGPVYTALSSAEF